MGGQWYSLLEVLSYIMSGELSEGSKIVNTNGQQALVKSKGLYWVTDSGYISNPVSITAEAFNVAWRASLGNKRIDFPEAMSYLYAGGVGITFTLEHSTYHVDSLFRFEQDVLTNEYLYDVYDAYITVNVDDLKVNIEEPAETDTSDSITALYEKFISNTVMLSDEDKEPDEVTAE